MSDKAELQLLDPRVPVRHFKHWGKSRLSLPYRLQELAEASGFDSFIEEGDLVAVKVHFGDHGTSRTLRSPYIRKIVELIKAQGGDPFITETTGLGMVHDRSTALGRLKIAQENGYTSETCGAPLVIADGMKGFEYVEVDGPMPMNKVALAGAIYEADKVVALSHVTGHMSSGFAGAIKNIGIGCTAKPTKFDFHLEDKPEIIEEKCTFCKECEVLCPSDAIEAPVIHKDRCIKCGGCNEVCRPKAIRMPWSSDVFLGERTAKAAKAVVDAKGRENFFYFNFLLEVTPHCDCFSFSDSPIVGDIGVLAGEDPLAIDKASEDLINSSQGLKNTMVENHGIKEGEDKLLKLWDADYRVQFNTAENVGLGTREYSINRLKVRID